MIDAREAIFQIADRGGYGRAESRVVSRARCSTQRCITDGDPGCPGHVLPHFPAARAFHNAQARAMLPGCRLVMLSPSLSER